METTTESLLPRLLTTAEVAALLRCSRVHVIRLARDGGLPRPLRIGAILRWREDVILEWLESGALHVADERGDSDG